jgi:ribonuclease P protein component
MLPQKNRLPYMELNAGGYRTVRTPYFSLKIRKNGLPQNRIGAIIGVAAEKRAVRRNFWKRQAKGILAKQPNALQGSGGGKDFVVIFSKKIKEISKMQFKDELLKAVSSLV